MINYASLQTSGKTILQGFGAVAVNVRLLNDSVISTIGVFDSGVAKNIDNIQNATHLTGETTRVVYVPGIDFFGAIAPGQTTTPQVSGSVEWTINGVFYKKNIDTVEMLMPLPNVPVLFTLGIS
jgi:hypothetical protein